MENREFRKIQDYEIRQITEDNNNKVIIEGYIAKFDSPTELWDNYFEKIDKRAFNDTLSDGHNIFLLYHHDWTKPLASTKTSTLELEVDNVGLRFKATINNNLSYGKDTIELVKEGLIEGCSFGFCTLKEDYDYNYEEDIGTRTLLKVALFEGSVLCIPQYEDTEVFTRAKEGIEAEKEKFKQNIELEALKTELELIKIKNELL